MRTGTFHKRVAPPKTNHARGRGGTPSGMACQATPLRLRSVGGHFASAVERSFPGVGRTDAYSPASRTDTHGPYNLILRLPFSRRPAVRILDLWSFRCTSHGNVSNRDAVGV